MKILIVNCYENQNEIVTFKEQLKKTTQEIHDFGEWMETVVIKPYTELEKYLWKYEGEYQEEYSALQFDQLDLILVIGNNKELPWNQKSYQLLILLEMCLKVKKNLLATQFGLYCLIYLSASNIERVILLKNLFTNNLRIILCPFQKNIEYFLQKILICNGNQRGSKLLDIYNQNKKTIKRSHDEYFLNNQNGDLLQFNIQYNCWESKGNVGIHNIKSSQDFDNKGKYIINKPIIYQPHHCSDYEMSYVNSVDSEEFVFLKKSKLTHWVLNGVNLQFKAPVKKTWDIHPFYCINKAKKFEILALNDRDVPSIIIYHDKIYAQMFEINFVKYPQTYKLLKNFLTKAHNQLKDRLEIEENLIKQKALPQFKIEIVTKNNIQKQKVKNVVDDEDETEQQLEQDNYKDDQSQSEKPHIKPSFQDSSIKFKTNFIMKNYQNAKQKKSPLQKFQIVDKKPLVQNNDDENTLTQFDVRQQLHPNFSQELLLSRSRSKIWIPGNLSLNKLTQNAPNKISKPQLSELDTSLIKQNSSRIYSPHFREQELFSPSNSIYSKQIQMNPTQINKFTTVFDHKFRSLFPQKWITSKDFAVPLTLKSQIF